MTAERKSLGTAIDELIAALEPLDELARNTAIQAACSHLGVRFAAGTKSEAPSAFAPPSIPDADRAANPQVSDIRSFKNQKNPTSATEMACVLAYYLQRLATEDERKAGITAADVDKYFVQADFPLPKRSDQLLVNAKAAGYFDSASRGEYRLNPVGHNLVAHSLPRTEGSAAPRSRSKAIRGRAGHMRVRKSRSSAKK